MKISIITLFPEVFQPILASSILKRAQEKGKVSFELINLRNFGEGKHQAVDDRPYGGGAGMVLRADILAKSLKHIISKLPTTNPSTSSFDPEVLRTEGLGAGYQLPTLLMSASGNPYNQKKAKDLSMLDHLIIICGHYEGIDQRFVDKYVTEEISIGDYILTGGEIPAMVIVDTVTRLIPGVLEKPEATENESFSYYQLPTPRLRPSILKSSGLKGSGQATNYQLLEYPQYTRPEEFEGLRVPEVLLSGNHKEIEKWRRNKSLEKTRHVRPELLT